VLWKAQIGQSYASVAVQGERLFTIGAADGQETVSCLNARTGKPIWRFSRPHPKREEQYDPTPHASTASPVVAAERVYLLTREGTAFCLAAGDGKLLWERDLAQQTENGLPPFGCAGSPVIYGDRILYNMGKSGVALEAATGRILWNSGPGVAGHASPVLYRSGERDLAAFFTGSGLAAVDPGTGAVLWRFPWNSPNRIYAVDPVVSGNRLLLSGYGRSQQLRLDGAEPVTTYDLRVLRSTFNNPVLLGGYLYGSDRGTLQCVEWETGTENWRQADVLRRPAKELPAGERDNPMSEGALIAAGKHLLILEDAGTLRVAEATPAAYREVAKAKVLNGPCWSSPVLAHGLLYCHNNAGDLVCLDLRPAGR
jgi:outer membrane protein assembly factor BamB